jgi:hypothetical protein
MKAIIYTILLGFCTILLSPQVQAKEKARLSVDYHRIMGKNGFLLINAKYKVEKKYEPATELNLNIYEEINEDSIALRGKVITDYEGNAQFVIEARNVVSDELVTYKYLVRIEDDEIFKDAEKSESFLDVNLVASAIEEDSVNYISAELTDANGDPIEGEKLQVVVQRLFAPLTIGESSNKTDEDGSILVAVENPLPGLDGILTFEVILESKKYGNVKVVFDAPIGKVITDLSTFDQRTMWSPPGKTPLFLLIFPNIVIFGIWIVIVTLIFNLFRIYKSNKQTKKS